jgi:hypothetical protein
VELQANEQLKEQPNCILGIYASKEHNKQKFWKVQNKHQDKTSGLGSSMRSHVSDTEADVLDVGALLQSINLLEDRDPTYKTLLLTSHSYIQVLLNHSCAHMPGFCHCRLSVPHPHNNNCNAQKSCSQNVSRAQLFCMIHPEHMFIPGATLTFSTASSSARLACRPGDQTPSVKKRRKDQEYSFQLRSDRSSVTRRYLMTAWMDRVS